MNRTKIKLLVITNITLVIVAGYFVYNFQSPELRQQLETLKDLGYDASKYEKINNFSSVIYGSLEKYKSEISQIISETKENNKQEEISNSQELTKISKLLNKYTDSGLKSPKYSGLQEQRYILNQYRSYLDDMITSRKVNNQFINPFWTKSNVELNSIIKSLSVEQLVSQLMIVGFDSLSLDTKTVIDLKTFQPGGYILMGKNIDNANQVKSLNTQLQNINSIPTIITTDQEGGQVKRINWDPTEGVKDFKNKSKEELCAQATTRSKLLLDLGINNNLAPVVDLSYQNSDAFINNRTISSDPSIVSEKVKDYLSCYSINNTSALKHFPGHGMVTGDSHIVIPANSVISKQEWNNSHAKPFINNLNAEMILTAHIRINNIDQVPASMSPKWIKDILRNEINYQGVVITDDMNQFKNISGEDMTFSAIKALEAGNDMLLYVPSYNNLYEVKSGLIKHFTNSRYLLEEKVKRVFEMKSVL